MFDLVAWMNGAIEHNAGLAPLIFALIAFAESTAFVGIIVPATPVLFLVGSMIGWGRLDPWAIIPGAILGAFLGYGLSYVAGRLLGRSFTRYQWLRSHRRSVARARLFFSRYGVLSLFLGRYVLGPFQSLVPFVAGTLKMSARRFWISNLASGIVWVFLTLAPGYIVARSMRETGIGAEWQNAASGVLLAVSGGAVVICLAVALAKGLAGMVRARRRRAG